MATKLISIERGIATETIIAFLKPKAIKTTIITKAIPCKRFIIKSEIDLSMLSGSKDISSIIKSSGKSFFVLSIRCRTSLPIGIIFFPDLKKPASKTAFFPFCLVLYFTSLLSNIFTVARSLSQTELPFSVDV